MKFKNQCPRCGSNLILKDGVYGEFLACPRFPDCRYTKSINDEDEVLQPPPKYCEKCNHTGLLPFKKNGKLIPYVYLDCECRIEEEHYHSILLEDFDFPCSEDWRNFYEYYYHGKYPEEPPKERTIVQPIRDRVIVKHIYSEISATSTKKKQYTDKFITNK